ncbi:MAG: ferric reductase-like transmembrane domain-containing protein [Bacteroidia bacterium]|nr:ferric reductase-like transmembrane domain-containing protein [Bacteroidia bacterium]
MAVIYNAIGWNRQKKVYDWLILGMVVLYIGLFVGLNIVFSPGITPETLIIRAFGSLAIIMLHIILAIGPMARLYPRFLPILYNRRHLGVSMFLIAAVHGVFSIIQFHTLGSLNPFVSLFVSNSDYGNLSRFPFEILGFFALVILFLMAATSHDFWLNTLSPRVWKTLHMSVYVAWALVVMHVMLGVVQYDTSPLTVGFIGSGMALLIVLHLMAGLKQNRENKSEYQLENGFVRVCEVNEISDKRAKMVLIGKENIAIFRYGNKLSALSNVCKHQNGPLGEGKIVNGCVVCPWHGYEYKPEDGTSPPPFKEKVATYNLRLVGSAVYVNPSPHPEGTRVEPLIIS